MVLLCGLGSSNPPFIRRVTTTATKAITPSQRLMRMVSGTHHIPDRRERCRRLRFGTVVFNFRGGAGEPRDETADIKPLNSAFSYSQSKAITRFLHWPTNHLSPRHPPCDPQHTFKLVLR